LPHGAGADIALAGEERQEIVTERTAGDRLAALEQARAQIEIALEADRDWAAFRQAASGPTRLLRGRVLAGNPLFESWLLLERAIGDLKAKATQGNEATSDDLARIRGIDRALAGHLAARGITRYGQIAAWRADDVRDVAASLGLGRRISRQNWIEQAALLDLRRRADAPGPVAAPTEAARSETPRIGLQQILEHIRSDAALRDVELPMPSEPSLDVNAELGERDQGEPHAPAAVDGGPGSETAGGGLPEPEEATVTFVIRERVHAADEASEDGIAPSAATGKAAAVEAVDAPCAPHGIEAEEAEVVIVSRTARSPAKLGRR
jgi:hypothetical protein